MVSDQRPPSRSSPDVQRPSSRSSPDVQRPPSRSSPEVSASLPPKLNLNATRGMPRTARAIGTVRSLSPALQVLQRSMQAPGPDTPRLPDAPRGERPREYIAALSKAGVHHDHMVPSCPPPSPRQELRSKAVESLLEVSRRAKESLLGGIEKGQLEEIFAKRAQVKACAGGVRAASPNLGARAASPTLGAAGVCAASPGGVRPASSGGGKVYTRQDTPLDVSDARQNRAKRAPRSARVTRSSSEDPTEASTAVHSARSSRHRPLSAAAQLWTLDEKVDVGEVWKRQMWPTERRRLGSEGAEGTLFSTAPQKDALNATTPRVVKRQPSLSDDPMDALDGLLASLDEERVMRTEKDEDRVMHTEKEKPLTRPRAVSTPNLGVTAASDVQEAKSAPGSKRKCGIAPAQGRLQIPIVARACQPVYDDAFDASSPHLEHRNLRSTIYGYTEAVVDLDESRASTDIYVDQSPTIMSVHMPGSPTPRARAAFQLDDASPAVAAGPARPCKVRVECRGSGTDSNSDKHVPQAPCRRHAGTGKLSSRPLGCMQRVANFGGA